jgi:exodeoxyribonuclease V alpha subunit
MNAKLTELVSKNILTEMNIRFAEFIKELSGSNNEVLFYLMLIISRWTEEGHICLNLNNLCNETLNEITDGFDFPETDRIREILLDSGCVGIPGDSAPLILDNNLLYFERFYSDEKELLKNIFLRLNKKITLPLNFQKIIKGLVQDLFPENNNNINWQAVSAVTAVLKYFTVISGGPGTGKTTTVIKILILLIEINNKLFNPVKPLNIILCAPTGKAAARLKESLENYKDNLNIRDDNLLSLPKEGYTIHRLINELKRDYTAPPDIVVVDEASMADLSILRKLFSAIPDTTRVILLGDKDQLASVEAGAVLGDICSGVADYNYSGSFYKCIEKYCGYKTDNQHSERIPEIRDSIILLERNYRFKGILSEMSSAVNNGDSDRLLEILNNSQGNEIIWIDPESEKDYRNRIKEYIIRMYSSYINEKDTRKAYNLFNSFRVLCALRRGPFGVETVNKWIENILKEKALINPYRQFYINRPVMITRNDYTTGLFNGDIGILRKAQDNNIYIYFKNTEGCLKKFSPYKIKDVDTVYSMTVHKSQGSEFNNVMLILPDTPNPVVTRELIYTGITRTKSQIFIIAKKSVLLDCISKTIQRTSGIYKSLWKTIE